jgi:cyclohexadieny/prephenate dehydrogenase
VKDADLVIVCVPVGACGAVAEAIAAGLKPGAIVSDVGSVKGSVIAQMAPHLPRACTSCPAIRSPAPNIPAPTRASPNCSTTAGAS